jgi:branched-chain amino acid transport system permease protein
MIAIILDGFVFGIQLGLWAAGLTLIYGLGGVLNLAHGQIAVISAMVLAFAMDAGLPVVPAAGLALLVGGLVGLFLDLTILRPVYRLQGEARVLLSLLLTLGVAFIVDGFLNWRYPGRALSLFIGGGAIDVLGVPMRRGSLLASAITLVAFAALFSFCG